MSAQILDGKYVASLTISEIQQTISKHVQWGTRQPCLAVILIGDDHAATLYVNNKQKACQTTGIRSILHHLDTNITESALLSLIDELNASLDIDGILIQLPLPKHIRTNIIIEQINPDKDVDGFHPLNIGKLAQGTPYLRPCTPMGIMNLLQHYEIDVSGLSALVIGSSNIVGRPMALELLLAKATVTIAHRQTQQLEKHIQDADLIVSATGIRNLIPTHALSERQIIIDVGIHRSKHNTVCGDIDFEEVKQHVNWITPVPGGVGPMTIAMLLKNTLQCWSKHLHLSTSLQSKSSSNSPS